MHRVTRMVGTAYAGVWLLWSTWIAFGPEGLIKTARRSPTLLNQGVVESLAWLLLTPLVGLLVSFRFVRRGRFRGAAIALLFCVLFTIAASASVDAVGRLLSAPSRR